MSTPTYPSKRFYKAGAHKGTDWGTPVALGAGDGLLCTNDGNPQLKQAYDFSGAIDQIVPKGGRLGVIDATDFSPEFELSYEPGQLGAMIAALYGIAGVPAATEFIVDATNNKIDFKESAAELTGTVASGTYSAADLATAIAAAMNAAVGKALTYTCSYSGSTHKFTIGAGGTFTICWNTGTHKATDISTLCGYSDAADDTTASAYVSDTAVTGNDGYTHVFKWADYPSDFFTFCSSRPGTILEVPSAMPTKLGIKVSGGILMATMGLRGNDVNQDSTTNTDTQMSALTYADREKVIEFQSASLLINEQGDGALSSGDEVIISDFTLDIERSVDAVQCSGGNNIALPVEGPFPKFTLKITIPRATADNLAQAGFKAMTAYKATLTFTGPTGYSLAFIFPQLKFQAPPEGQLEDVIKSVQTFLGEEAATAPTGMTGYTRPAIELTNTRATDYLA